MMDENFTRQQPSTKGIEAFFNSSIYLNKMKSVAKRGKICGV